MIVEPDQRVPDFIKAGADIVSVHCEQSSTIHLHRAVNQVRFSSYPCDFMLNHLYVCVIWSLLIIHKIQY